ncbi:MAG: carbohydrate ABC transporter permease [Caldilineaceae bacterium]|nr:carbohydrate ABC transporter permease [Caldilineaceae bacterium]MCL4832005.1 carbohydrate ABC transporter permease [Caldilineaceae bacterium]HRJ41995.1 carbohydrate ABC transporter permease [Caldilineaceae bacterium]
MTINSAELPTPKMSTPVAGKPTGFSLSRMLLNIVLAFWAALVVFPMLWLLYTSFKTDKEIFFSPWSLPEALQWDNYVRGWVDAHIGDYFLNSFIVVLPSLVLILGLSAMTAYVLARFPFPGNRIIFYGFMAGMLFPVFLALIPLFFLVKDLGMLNSFPGLILVYTAYSLPFSVFFLTGFFKTLPSELHEAAIIDGANQFQVFFRVMLPLAQPGLLSIGIFNFLGMWNQYLLPLVLMSDAKNYVLTQGLAYMLHQQYYQNDWSALFAAVSMIMIPTLLVYSIFQSQIQKGITVGALKG